MEKKLIFILLFVCLLLQINAQYKSPYTLYNAEGKKVSYKKMLRVLKDKEIVLFGEFHNNAIAHWLQLAVTKDLHQNNK